MVVRSCLLRLRPAPYHLVSVVTGSRLPVRLKPNVSYQALGCSVRCCCCACSATLALDLRCVIVWTYDGLTAPSQKRLHLQPAELVPHALLERVAEEARRVNLRSVPFFEGFMGFVLCRGQRAQCDRLLGSRIRVNRVPQPLALSNIAS